MAILFYLQSKKNPAPIYVRIRQGKEIDAKAKTNYLINPELFENGKIKKYRVPSGADTDTKLEFKKKNNPLIELEKNLSDLSNQLTTLLNNKKDFEIINSDWLKDIINPKIEKIAPSRLTEYFEYYIDIKKNDIAPSTIKKLRVFKNRISRYEETIKPIYIENINIRFVTLFESWLRGDNYKKNTIIKTIKTVKEICNNSKIHGIKVHPELEQIALGKDYRYTRSEHITLSLEEIEKIKNTDFEDERLDIARDWLVISCDTAQRVSDFLVFNVDDIINIDGYKFIDLRQGKTDEPVYVLLRKPVLDIIKKRGGKFPPMFSENKGSNETIYNKLIKEVCRISGIKEKIVISVKDPKTNRHITKEICKYLAVSSHIGRRSFATNYYTQIDTTLLMSQTGHKGERQFMEYVGKPNKTNALGLAKGFEKLDSMNHKPAPMQVIKNTKQKRS
jgi:hypothetical protein